MHWKQKMKKSRLNIDYDYDIILLGISCHSKDYKLCWEINKTLNIQLIKEDNLCINIKYNQSLFSYYKFKDVENHIIYNLIANKGIEGGIFVSEYEKYDYLFIISKNLEETDYLIYLA